MVRCKRSSSWQLVQITVSICFHPGDDILISGENQGRLNRVKRQLMERHDVFDMGEMMCVLCTDLSRKI